MSLPPALSLIPDDPSITSVPTPQYSADFASIVGNAGDDSDGFEEQFSLAAGHVEHVAAFLDGFDGDLGELGQHAPGLDIVIEADAVNAYNDALTGGQPRFDDFQSHQVADRGRIFPGAVMAWLGAQAGQEFGPSASVDQNPLAPLVLTSRGLKIPPVVGDPPFPTKWWIRTPTGGTPPKFVKVELISDNTVFERVWHDDLKAGMQGADWNFYVDINPVQCGIFACEVRLYTDDTNFRSMRLTTQVWLTHAQQACPPPAPPSGGGGTGGGGTGGAPPTPPSGGGPPHPRGPASL